MSKKTSSKQSVRDIRRKTRKQYFAEENIRIVLERLRGQKSITALCRLEGIAQNETVVQRIRAAIFFCAMSELGQYRLF